MMQVTVLGAGGRTGRLVAAELARRGHDVRALVRDAGRAALPAGIVGEAPFVAGR